MGRSRVLPRNRGEEFLLPDYFFDFVAQVAEGFGDGRAEGTRGLLGPLAHLGVLGRRLEGAENGVGRLTQLFERAVELRGGLLVGRAAIVAFQFAGKALDVRLK